MNLNIIKACKKVDDYIKELPEDFSQDMWELFNDMKKVSLERDEYIETLDEPLKSNMKSNLAKGAMLSRIRAACNDEDIVKVLSEEYLFMNASSLMNDLMKVMSNDETKNSLDRLPGLRETFKEIYEQKADKIAAYRAELGLSNPFSE